VSILSQLHVRHARAFLRQFDIPLKLFLTVFLQFENLSFGHPGALQFDFFIHILQENWLSVRDTVLCIVSIAIL
jgi:hypothetical protein